MSTDALQAVLPPIQECLHRKQSACLATVIEGPHQGNKILLLADERHFGDLGQPALNQEILSYAPNIRKPQDPTLLSLSTPQGETRIFIEYVLPPARLVIVGAVHIAIPLVALAKTLNFETIVVDARSAFATIERFLHADQLIIEWPANALEKLALDSAAFVVCLSHDEKLDNPALQVALDSPAPYIGVLGSRKTHAKRLDALRKLGISDTDLARIHAPIGLDLGSRYPEEIALAIMAEIIAKRHGITLVKKPN